MADVPEDLLIEIFTKLPIKSLIRFKSLCTYCSALFGTQSFISLHSRNSKTKILVKTLESDCFSIISCSNDDNSDGFTFLDLMPRSGLVSHFESRLRIVDSCNGLVCLSSASDPELIYIRNIGTRESRFVPRIGCDYGGSVLGRKNLRFVYNATNDDYYVVRVVSVLHPNNVTSTVLVELYSLKAACWGLLDDANVPKAMRSDKRWLEKFETSTSGVPCWWFFDKGVIVTFDVSTQLFHETSLPDHLHDARDRIGMKMMTLNGSLALLTSQRSVDRKQKVCDIWVLGEIGVKESWSQRFSIEPFNGDFVPIGFWGDFGLVFKYRISHPMGCAELNGSEYYIKYVDKLFLYVFEEERMKNVEIDGGLYQNYRAAPILVNGDDVDVQVVNHVETLVPLKMSFKRKRSYC